MNLQNEDIVSHINFIISELLHLKNKLTIKPGIHFNVALGDNWIAIEQWDTDLQEPRLLCYLTNIEKEKFDDIVKQELMKALNTLGIRAYKKKIYWNSDFAWDNLPENFKKLNMIYDIEEEILSSDLRKELMERINALYNMSEQS